MGSGTPSLSNIEAWSWKLVRRIGIPMPRVCTICRHRRRCEIDQALLAGVSLRDIAPTVRRDKGRAAPPPHGALEVSG
jgi:hypothetical protein